MTIPPERLRRIRSYLAGDFEVKDPRPAATVLLLREGADGLETFLMRRSRTMSFAPGVHVFPGGSVDTGDTEPVHAWAGPSPTQWARSLGCEPQAAAALVCAAVRETFEESNILLASPQAPASSIGGTADDWTAARVAMAQHQMSLPATLNRRGWILRTDLLRPWTRWVTPEWSPQRYDTHFFLATVPAGQQAAAVSRETDEAAWYPVDAALEAFRDGTLPLMLPTAAALREVHAHGNLSTAFAASRRPQRYQVRPVIDNGVINLVVGGPDGDVAPQELTS